MLQRTSFQTKINIQSILILGALLLCLGIFQNPILAEEISKADSAIQSRRVYMNDTSRFNRIRPRLIDTVQVNNIGGTQKPNAVQTKTDSLAGDQIYFHNPDTIFNDVKVVYKYSNSKRAVLYSMILPGLGQIYNKKYWKLPIIYGGGAIIYFFYDYNNGYYQRFKTAHTQILKYEEEAAAHAGDENWEEYNPVTDVELQGMTKETIALNRDFYRRNRDYDIIFFGLLYVANIIDAMVDSYMLYYDVSDQLTLEIDPYTEPILQFAGKQNFSPTFGLSLKLNLK